MIELLLEIKKKVDEQKQLHPGEISDFENRYIAIVAQGYLVNPLLNR